jgi:GT2 family glycosyltransferase
MDTLASVIIVTYNHKRYLEQCINSVLKQDYPYEVIIIDNCSQDGSAQQVRENYPGVKLIESEENRGYGAGTNTGISHAIGEYIAILNPDTIVETGWLRNLVKPLDNGKVITSAKILSYDGSAINTCGHINHFTGLTFTRGLGAEPSAYQNLEEVSGFSGCCFAMRRRDYLELGGFDENFFLYNDDSDLSWRAHLKGFTILFVPTSIVRHDYSLRVSPEKIYHLEKGRYMILRKYLSWKDFLILSPSLLIVELLTFGFALKLGGGAFFYKFRAIKDCLTTKTYTVRGDKKNLFGHLSTTIPVDQLTYNKSEKMFKLFANIVFDWNFGILRFFFRYVKDLKDEKTFNY